MTIFSHTVEGRIGEWISTYTGRKFYPLDPRSTEISELDIAHHSNRQGRENDSR